jgi:hypothetical protein
LGCAVPLTVQINNNLSNSIALPIAAAGSRTCAPVNPAYTTAQVMLTTSNVPITYGEINLTRQDNYRQGGSGFNDGFDGGFLRFSIPSAVQPFFFSYIDVAPPGTCQTFNSLDRPDPPLTDLVGLDAGSQITLQGPNGSKTATLDQGQFQTTLSDTGNFLSAGQYTVSASGGTGVLPFSAAITPFTVTRASGLTVTWSGGSPTGFILINGSSATDNTFSNGASFSCLAPAGSGTFTIPQSVLLALPPTTFGELQFQPVVSGNWTGSGLSVTTISAAYNYFTPLAFK